MFKMENKASNWFANEKEILSFLGIKNITLLDVMIEKEIIYEEFLLRLNFAKIIDYYQQNNEEKKVYIEFEIGWENGYNYLLIRLTDYDFSEIENDLKITEKDLDTSTAWDCYNKVNDIINKYWID